MRERPRFYHSIYFRIAGLFALALIAIAGVEFVVSINGFRRMVSEVEQANQWDVAANLANELQPKLRNEVSHLEFVRLTYPYLFANPKLEIFLIDSMGKLLLGSPYGYSFRAVEMADVKHALQELRPDLPVMGVNPRTKEGKQTFSVAPIVYAGQPAFLYIILEGGLVDLYIEKSGNFFVTRILTIGGVMTIATALLVGYVLLSWLSRRFRRLSEVAAQYSAGDYSQSLDIRSTDEIGILSRTLDNMAGQLIQSKQEISMRDTLRRELIATIVHDLRSPITSMAGFNSLALEHPAVVDHPNLRRDLEIVQDNIQLQERLVSDLFELSKLEAREGTPDFDFVQLEPFVRRTLERFEPKVDQRGISLNFSADERVPAVLADPIMLVRIFDNLLENAVRYTPEGGMIAVSLEHIDGNVRVTVADSGPGIPESERERLQQKFEQADQLDVEYRGAGLGLAIVKRILELHDSCLEVSNSASGGAMFRFTLLCGPDEREAEREEGTL